MARPPVRRSRIERPAARRARDGAYVALAVIILGLAAVGLASGISFLSGSRLVVSSSSNTKISRHAHHAAKMLIKKARHHADVIVRDARRSARKDRALILYQARGRSQNLLRTARIKARRVRSSARARAAQLAASPTAPVAPQAAPVAAPQSAPAVPQTAPAVQQSAPSSVQPVTAGRGGGAAPGSSSGNSISNGRGGSQPFPRSATVPKSWTVFAPGANGAAGTVDIVNRSGEPSSGTVSLTYFGNGGKIVIIRVGHFVNVPGHSSTVVAVGSPPGSWLRYQVGVSGVH